MIIKDEQTYEVKSLRQVMRLEADIRRYNKAIKEIVLFSSETEYPNLVVYFQSEAAFGPAIYIEPSKSATKAFKADFEAIGIMLSRLLSCSFSIYRSGAK